MLGLEGFLHMAPLIVNGLKKIDYCNCVCEKVMFQSMGGAMESNIEWRVNRINID